MTLVAAIATIFIMVKVGIKDLENNLNRYLDMVRNGETVLVSDNDETIRIEKEPAAPEGKTSKWEKFCDEMIRKGRMIPAKRKNINIRELIKDLEPAPEGVDCLTVLNETRKDRFE